MADPVLSGEVKGVDLRPSGVAVQGICQDLPSGSSVTTKIFQKQSEQEQRKPTRAEKGKGIESPNPPPALAQQQQPHPFKPTAWSSSEGWKNFEQGECSKASNGSKFKQERAAVLSRTLMSTVSRQSRSSRAFTASPAEGR